MENKICAFCGQEFTPNNGKQKCCCRKCNVKLWRKNNPEKAKELERRQNEKRKGIKRYNSEKRKEWYSKKREDKEWVRKINDQYNKRREKIQQYLRDYKTSKGCADCGYNGHHVALQFHHIDGNEKEFNVCNAKSIKQAKEEIEKCIVLCANCHAIRTYNKIQNNK